VLYVLHYKVGGGLQGVGIWGDIEVEGAAHKMVGGIGSGELVSGCRVATDGVEYAAYTIVVSKALCLVAISFLMVKEGIAPCFVYQLHQCLVGSYRLVGYVYNALEAVNDYVYPVLVRYRAFAEHGIAFYGAVGRILEGVGELGIQEQLILMGGGCI